MIPKINPHKVVPQNNWVLIRPTEDIFRVSANGLGGLALDTTWQPWLHPVIYGEIIAIPAELDYWSFEKAMKHAVDGRHILEDRLSFKVDIDVIPGDEVYFNYVAADNAIKMSRIFVWDDEIYIFVRYDLLLGRIRKKEFTSLNGWIYYEKIETKIRNQHSEGSVVFSEHSNQLALGSKTYRRQMGTIKSISLVEEYFWHSEPKQRDYYQPHNLFKVGNVIMFDHKTDLKLENDQSRVSDIGWRRVQEKDIMGWFVGENDFEPNKGRILVAADPVPEEKAGIHTPESFRKPRTEGTVVKCSGMKMDNWFDEIKVGSRIKFNVNDPKMLIGIGEENYIVLKPQNIIHFQ